MPKREIPLLPDNIYHIYNRGVNKEPIFFSERNYNFFIKQMQKYLLTNSDILAYCLMPNHFHLLVKVKSTKFLQMSLQPFLMSYSMSINKEQDRVGPLFQGRYKYMLIDDEGYLLECMKYIHLNPVKANLKDKPESWEYSSYHYYVQKEVGGFVNTSLIMSYFENTNDFREFVVSGIEQPELKFFKEE